MLSIANRPLNYWILNKKQPNDDYVRNIVKDSVRKYTMQINNEKKLVPADCEPSSLAGSGIIFLFILTATLMFVKHIKSIK